MANNLKCLYCDKTLKNGKMLKLHKIRMHGFQENGINKSPTAMPEVVSEKSLENKTNFQCKICNYGNTFSSKRNLESHIASIHKGEKNYPCDYCTKSFTQDHSRKRHMSTFHSSSGIKNELSENGKSQILEDDSFTSIMDYYTEQNFKPNLDLNLKQNIESNSEPDPLDTTTPKTNYVHESMIKCTECNKYFNKSSNLKAHVDGVHRGIKKFDCEKCEKSFSQKSNLKTHINAIHEGKKVYDCDLCDKSFKEKRNKINHEKSAHQKLKDYQCDYCPKAFTQDHNRKNHIFKYHSEIHVKTEPTDTKVETKECILPPPSKMTPVSQTAKKFKCDSCEKLFKTKMYLAIHMYNTHDRVVFPEISEKNVENTISKIIHENNTSNLDNIDQIQEDNTEEKFHIELEKVKSEPQEENEKIPEEEITTENEYEKINNRENPELNCDQCDKSFLDHESYSNHYKRVHNEKKSVKCSLCDKKFTAKRSVYSHIQNVHSGVREHKCDLCGILFQKFSNLNSHYDAVHEKVKNHKCTECGKSFSQKSNLKTHLDYVHRGQSKYICKSCGKMYKTMRNLNLHVNSAHEFIKDHKCDICDKSFSQRVSLQRHLQSVHKEDRKSECHICSKTFEKYQDLKMHMKSVHVVVKEEILSNQKAYVESTKSTTNQNSLFADGFKINTISEKNRENSTPKNSTILPLMAPLFLNDFQCNSCEPGKPFSSKRNLQNHIKSVHQGLRDFPCDYCSKSFTQDHSRKRHMLSFHKQASIKGEVSKHKVLPNSELNLESNSKPIDDTHKADMDMKEPNSDLISQPKSKPNYAPNSKMDSELNSEPNSRPNEDIVPNTEIDMKEPNYDPISESNFETNSEWYSDLVSDSNFKMNSESKFKMNFDPTSESIKNSLGMVQCPICDITFAGTSTTVEMHLKNVHKKFKCELCEKIFDKKFNLKVHTKTEHSKDKEENIDCDFCDQSFVKKPKFKDHMMKIHNMSESKFKKFW